MARFGVTYQDIANVANQIVGQGKQPTIELIRNHLGTGSTTTIANHLRKWRTEQDSSTSVAIKENLPQEFISVMKGLWQRLKAHADNQIMAVKEAAEQQMLQLQQEVEKYKTNNQRWQKMHDSWVREKETFARDKLTFEQAIHSLQTEKVTMAAQLNAQQNQFNEKQQRIDELHRLHKQAQENLEHYRESARVQRLIDQEKQTQQVNQVQIQLKNTEQQLLKANQNMMHLQKQLDTYANENTLLQKTNEEIKQQVAKLQVVLDSTKNEYADAKRDAIHWKKQHDMLENNVADKQICLVELEKTNALSSQQLSMLRDEVIELKEQNRFLAREKWEIAEEKARLEGINKQMEKMMALS